MTVLLCLLCLASANSAVSSQVLGQEDEAIYQIQAVDTGSTGGGEHPILPSGAAVLSKNDAVLPAPKAAPTRFSKRWELDQETRQDLFTVCPHKPTYFLPFKWTNSVNDEPFRPLLDLDQTQNLSLDSVEAKFQLSFKIKAFEDAAATHTAVWFGYTQQNNWQVYNKNISSPFRETNYEPEVFVIHPVDVPLMGIRMRFAGIGFVHQSNGKAEPLSRSWNRVYVELGFESGDEFSMILKPWYRIRESAGDDNNPDMEDYTGRFEALLSFLWRGNSISLLPRSNLSIHHHRGSVQVEWSRPLYHDLRFYLQGFSGYGESMIDYNHSQTTVGVGFMLKDWQ